MKSSSVNLHLLVYAATSSSLIFSCFSASSIWRVASANFSHVSSRSFSTWSPNRRKRSHSLLEAENIWSSCLRVKVSTLAIDMWHPTRDTQFVTFNRWHSNCAIVPVNVWQLTCDIEHDPLNYCRSLSIPSLHAWLSCRVAGSHRLSPSAWRWVLPLDSATQFLFAPIVPEV